MTTFNKTVEDYNKLRKLLRYIFVYGCFTRDDYPKRKIGVRFYDNELRRIRELIDEQFLVEDRIKKKKFISLKYDYYQTVENYLVQSFMNSNLRSNDLNLYIYILDTLATGEKAGIDDVMDRVICKFTEDIETIGELCEQYGSVKSVEKGIKELDQFDRNTFSRKLDFLYILGILTLEFKGNKKIFSIADDFFAHFDDEELQRIYQLACFFSHTKQPSVPGHYLKETISRYLKRYRGLESPKKTDFFLYRFLQFHQVLDEEIVWDILTAINQGKEIKIKYTPAKMNKTKTFTNVPLKIILDVKKGRWYFVGYRRNNKKFYTYPVHRIESIGILKSKADLEPLKKEFDETFRNSWLVAGNQGGQLKQVKIKFTLDEDAGYNFLLRMVKRDVKQLQLEIINDKEFIASTYVTDIMEINPWIKGFSYRAEVLPSSEHSLREHIKTEWEEVLRQYETV